MSLKTSLVMSPQNHQKELMNYFEVLRLLKENPVYTREEIAQKVSKTARTVQRALNRLKEDGKIVRIGNKVSGYWEVM